MTKTTSSHLSILFAAVALLALDADVPARADPVLPASASAAVAAGAGEDAEDAVATEDAEADVAAAADAEAAADGARAAEARAAAEAARADAQASRARAQAARAEADAARAQADAERAERAARVQAFLEARRALDEERWAEASEMFEELAGELARLAMPQAGAALYWLAYADAQAGRITGALSAIDTLLERFPLDAFVDDALALQLELEGRAGALPGAAPPPPGVEPPAAPFPLEELGAEISRRLREARTEIELRLDGHAGGAGRRLDDVEDELRLLALEGLMETNPDRAMAYLREFLAEDGDPVAQRRALFVLAHSGHPDTAAVLGEVVRSASSPMLRGEALRLAGIALEAGQASALIEQVYTSLDSRTLRARAIEGLMLASDTDGLASLARRETDPALRAQIVRHLGMLGAVDALRELYRGEGDEQVRAAMLDGFALAGDAGMLLEIAGDTQDDALARRAVRALSLLDAGTLAPDALPALYRSRDDAAFRRAVADALAMRGDGEALLALYRETEDPRERAMLVQTLRRVGGEAVEQLFIEILEADANP